MTEKEIFIRPGNADLLQKAYALGFRNFFAEPVAELKEAVFMSEDPKSQLVIDGKRTVVAKVSNREELDALVKLSDKGAKRVIVETTDWKVIPLENLIAELHSRGTQLFACGEVSSRPLLFTIMEKGVDGVVLSVGSHDELEQLNASGDQGESPELSEGEVVAVEEAGVGDRVCVDTASILERGEGVLVGNTSSFFFLVHNENVRSEFTEPRPFRVNAGAVHCYILQPGGKTKYLSELSAGDQLLVVSPSGSRQCVLGRAKIERRPLILIRAMTKRGEGSVLVQQAETIRLVGPSGNAISVTELRPGERILVHEETSGRHFGTKVDEFILEK